MPASRTARQNSLIFCEASKIAFYHLGLHHVCTASFCSIAAHIKSACCRDPLYICLLEKLLHLEGDGDPFSIINIYLDEEEQRFRFKEQNLPQQQPGLQQVSTLQAQPADDQVEDHAWESTGDVIKDFNAKGYIQGRSISLASDRENVSLNIEGKMQSAAEHGDAHQPRIGENSKKGEQENAAGYKHTQLLGRAFQVRKGHHMPEGCYSRALKHN